MQIMFGVAINLKQQGMSQRSGYLSYVILGEFGIKSWPEEWLLSQDFGSFAQFLYANAGLLHKIR
jgi:hypothetical protein